VSKLRPLIAIVDDEESVRRALQRLMLSAGLDAHVFSGGAEFLEALPTDRPDCVVLDLHMPGMSGFDVQVRLTQSHQKVPVVAITGHDTPGSAARAREGGAAAYLRKPVTAELLLDAISTAIGSGTDDVSARKE
jgi:FixJ family two-component response regulator